MLESCKIAIDQNCTLSSTDQLDFQAQSGYRVEQAEHGMYIESK